MEWVKAAAVRAMKTFAQVVIGMVAVGAAISDVVWTNVLSVAVVAAVLSILTSLTGLPEVGSDGQLTVNTSDPMKDTYKLEINDPLESLAEKDMVKLTVKK